MDIDQLALTLNGGGVIALPTDTVFGLCALPERSTALDRLWVIKGRDRSSPFAVLCADDAQAESVASFSALARTLVHDHWPGALTVVLARAEASARWELGGDEKSIGVRVPNHQLVRALCERVGPIVATSANRTGNPPLKTAQAIATQFGAQLDAIVGGSADGIASTVVDLRRDTPVIIRQGAVDLSGELCEVDSPTM